MIRDIYETHIPVADLDRSRAFYEGKLKLEVGWINDAERRLLYWVGGSGRAMLGVREVPADQVHWQHFAFEVDLDDMEHAVSYLQGKGIKCENRIDRSATLQVFGWMPAVAIYFNDPDGHLLEFISMLPDAPRPEVGIITWDEWRQKYADCDA